MMRRLFTLMAACAMLAVAATTYGQGGTTSTLSGVVIDSAGGVVPGADIVAKHTATGTSQTSVTNSEGVFQFPALSVGTYTVTVTLQGFKTVVISDIVLTSGTGANVRATLEVGGLEEQVQVSSASEIVQTQSSTISSTFNANQISRLPIPSRNAMDLVTFTTGVSTPGGSRDSTINGLPQGSINITLDGVNVQDNTNKTGDGFFAIVSPRLDAVEEVTVTAAAQGADGAGQGAVQIKFVTRSGTNQFSGSGYEYFRNDKLNANTWFNERDGVAKVPLKQNQFGFRVGGPIMIPGLFDGRSKAFFFVNYEEFRQPGALTRQRTVLNAQAMQGIFTYGGTSVNLLNVAAATGNTTSPDPTVTKLFADIRGAVSGGSLTDIDPNLQRYTFNVPTQALNRYPTVRIDYDISSRNRFSSAWNYQTFYSFPDTLNNREATFPGFPVAAGQTSTRLGFSNSLRSTMRQNLVNEARVGYSSAPVVFFPEHTTSVFGGTSVADQKGFYLLFGTVQSALTNPSAAPAPQSRNATSLLIEDTLTWLKGAHSITGGFSFTQYDIWAKNSALVPEVRFAMANGDPAQAMFTGSNATTFFPGASAANLTAAQQLYALLTGRVDRVRADARIDESTGKYVPLGVGTQRAHMRETGFFMQDAWRLRPNLTVNVGLRYEIQFPFTPDNNSYSTATLADVCGISGVTNGQCNIFQPNVRSGKSPQFQNFSKGTPAYNTDTNNIAPSAGFAWSLPQRDGFVGKIVGSHGDAVIRGGFSRTFNRNGLGDLTGVYNGNPGLVITADRELVLGNLTPLPLLFRDQARLTPPLSQTEPTYPMTDVISGDIRIFDENIQVPYADTWQIGFQRAISRSMAVEVRYVGTRTADNWRALNYNEINIFENGFINEFRLAQGNLQANIAAGRGANFRYFGAGTGTSPLPTMFAFFQGAGNANDSAAYTSANFAATTYITPLAKFNPNVFNFANNLYNVPALLTNARGAGIPSNFFLANPDLQGGANITSNVDASRYHSLQLEVRRRLTDGLQFSTSYVFGKAMETEFRTLRREVFFRRDAGAEGDLTHAMKASVVYDLPFGQNRRFMGNAGGFMDRIVGGWTLGLTARVQSGRLVDFGNVRVVGMSTAEAAKLFKLRIDPAGRKVWMLPADVINETIKAYSVSATTASGYGNLGAPSGKYFAPANGPDCIEVDNGAGQGDCGVRELVFTGPMFRQYDLSIAKRVSIKGRVNAEFRIDAINVFDTVNYAPQGLPTGNNTPTTTLASWEVTGLAGATNARVVQLVARINW